MNTLDTIKVLLVPVAFESRIVNEILKFLAFWHTHDQGGRKFYRSEARLFSNVLGPTFGIFYVPPKAINF